MNNYQKNKEKLRQNAIEWQHDFATKNYSYNELLFWQEYFYKLGKRYGLLKEVKENGIC